MIHNDYLQFIETLAVQFGEANSMQVLQPLAIEQLGGIGNILMRIHGGQASYVQAGKKKLLQPGDLLFIPQGKPIKLIYGQAPTKSIHKTDFIQHSTQYLQALAQPLSAIPCSLESFSYVCFHTQVLEALNLFSTWDMPPLVIQDQQHLASLLQTILAEKAAQAIGQAQVLAINTKLLVIELLRHIYNKDLLADKLIAKQRYFKDKRLLSITSYISKHLSEDLSNSKLAAVAHISEDYMGQYFKLLTNTSPQAYVECQRLETAMKLLRTSSQPVYLISQQVGFKDTAYFCRRFKLKYGIQANKIRHLPHIWAL